MGNYLDYKKCILMFGVTVFSTGCGVMWNNVTRTPVTQVLPTPVFSWQFADGNGPNGINQNVAHGAKSAQMAMLNGNLYAAWREQTVGSTHDNIRVAKCNGSGSWSFVDGGGATGVAFDTVNDFSAYPSLVAFNNTLYLAWHESNGHYHIQVAAWDGNSTFNFVTASANGINFDGGEDAEHPQLYVFNSELYASWGENNQARVAKYVGGTTWNFVDGGGATGINYNSANPAGTPSFVDYNSHLYVAWNEDDGSGVPQMRFAEFNGTSTWTFLDGNGPEGLNYNTTLGAGGQEVITYDNKIILAWAENGIIRAKSFDGTTWAAIDNGGLNKDATQGASTSGLPQMALWNGKVALTWGENTSLYVGKAQVRVATYDGSNWEFIDGGNAIGLNYNPAYNEFFDSTLIAYGGGLMLLWGEQNSSNVYQLRASFGQLQ